ncbi:MAG: 30S ribosomal protein S20 [Chloroflexi bacterium]|nr:30S ribosomal protein S20 [Chloroflexota bacterium]
MRRDARVRLQTQRHRSRARTAVKQARQAIASGDLNAAEEAVREAAKWLDHAASKGVIHPNNASRRKSRLMKQLARLKAEK